MEEFDLQEEWEERIYAIVIMIIVKEVKPPGSCGKVGDMKEVSGVSTPDDDDII